MDNQTIIFRIPEEQSLDIDRDIQVRIFHAPDTSTKSRVTTMVNFSFHTGFMPGGVIRVAKDDLEILKRDLNENRFTPNFSVDLVFTNAVTYNDIRAGKIRPLTYQKLLSHDFGKGLSKLVRNIINRPDEGLYRTLVEVGCNRWLGTV
jgi:hypothetical protein